MTRTNFEKNAGTVIFAALLIVCSIAVGCSNDNPKPTIANNQNLSSPNLTPQTLASSSQPASDAQAPKAAAKKVVKKRPTTATYIDKTYGVSFEYPRRYAIETGDAADALVPSYPVPMNFVQPGGTALAAVELPETGFANTDFSSAFFNVSVHKAISAEDCAKFSVPQTPAGASPVAEKHADEPAPPATPSQNVPAQANANAVSAEAKTESAKPSEATGTSEAKASEPSSAAPATATIAPPTSLALADMEMQKIEAVSGEGNRQSDAKYFHAYHNGACYEFALNVTTVAAQVDGGMKHVDRDKVFARLETIMATVKFNPVELEKETASAPAPASSSNSATPAQ